MTLITGVVVLYHPNELEVLNNISSYIDEIDKLWVVANSHVDEQQFLLLPKVEFIQLDQNMGIAYALNLAAEKALDEGYEWLLTMDQDSSFVTNDFFKVFKAHKEKENVSIYSPLQVSEIKEGVYDHTKEEDEFMVMTSGNLLNLKIWLEVEGFEEKLFIDEVDIEFCLKSKLLGYRVIQFPNVFLKHALGEEKVINTFFFKKKIISHSPIRTFYMFRNALYVIDKYKCNFPEIARIRRKSLYKECIRIILLRKDSCEKIKMAIKGIYYFRKKKYGSI